MTNQVKKRIEGNLITSLYTKLTMTDKPYPNIIKILDT